MATNILSTVWINSRIHFQKQCSNILENPIWFRQMSSTFNLQKPSTKVCKAKKKNIKSEMYNYSAWTMRIIVSFCDVLGCHMMSLLILGPEATSVWNITDLTGSVLKCFVLMVKPGSLWNSTWCCFHWIGRIPADSRLKAPPGWAIIASVCVWLIKQSRGNLFYTELVMFVMLVSILPCRVGFERSSLSESGSSMTIISKHCAV